MTVPPPDGYAAHRCGGGLERGLEEVAEVLQRRQGHATLLWVGVDEDVGACVEMSGCVVRV